MATFNVRAGAGWEQSIDKWGTRDLHPPLAFPFCQKSNNQKKICVFTIPQTLKKLYCERITIGQ
jgi:hypothetical protein